MERTKKIQWAPQELDLLSELHPTFNSKKWKKISQVFKERGFNRNEIECREKWINFLDPSLNKNQWEEWELQKLYEVHEQVGTKWCLVQKIIGRTQNKIKNRFYGTLRNYIRFLACYFEPGSCYNRQISKLSPSFLNDIYCTSSQFKYLKGEIKDTINLMKYKVEKKILAHRIQTQKDLYKKLWQSISNKFAEIGAVRVRREVVESVNSESSLQQSSSESEQLQQIPDPVINQEKTIISSPFSNMHNIDQTNCSIPAMPFYPFLNYNVFYMYQ